MTPQTVGAGWVLLSVSVGYLVGVCVVNSWLARRVQNGPPFKPLARFKVFKSPSAKKLRATIAHLEADNMRMADELAQAHGRIVDLETELALAPAPVVSLTEDAHWASLVRESALARLREVRGDNVIPIQRDGA